AAFVNVLGKGRRSGQRQGERSKRKQTRDDRHRKLLRLPVIEGDASERNLYPSLTARPARIFLPRASGREFYRFSQAITPISLLTMNSARSEEHTSELQSRENLVCRLLLEKKTEARA